MQQFAARAVLKVPIFQVDAFTGTVFRGNPAAVCPLQSWLPDATLQAIAAENNLAETAYFVPRDGDYHLRWFTPRCEVKLCGHATLASAFVFFNFLDEARSSVKFETLSGRLTVSREAELLALDFPALAASICATPPSELLQGLAAKPALVVQANENYFAVYDSQEEVLALRPDLSWLEKLHPFGVCVTAPGKESDFVSRYFAPSYGIAEDPVTGSTHCSLTPYWAERMGKQKLHARQVSERGGELWCEMNRDRVVIKGKAALYLEGSIWI